MEQASVYSLVSQLAFGFRPRRADHETRPGVLPHGSAWRRSKRLLGALLLGLGVSTGAPAATTTLTFDDLFEGAIVSNLYDGIGVEAAGAVVASSDNLGWPYNTPFNLAYAPTGFMDFYLIPWLIGDIRQVSAYVSGYSSVWILAYDASGALVGQSETGGFSQNALLTVASSGNPIARVSIHDGGTAFAIDTLSFETASPLDTSYRLIPLDLGGWLGGVSALGINASGQVAGFAETASNASHAFFYADSAMLDLGTFGGTHSAASAVNDAGQVVGVADTKRKQQHAFSWTAAGGMVDLGTLGGSNSNANAVNNLGQVVGAAHTRQKQTHAFSWADGVMVDLGTLGGDNSSANDVNAAGQVVGWAQARKGLERAFLWESGTITDLGALGGTTSFASAINDAGQVVGGAETSSGQLHAFSWAEDVMVDLGTLGGATSEALEVNASGQVIGDADISTVQRHAFSWTSSGGMVDLGTLGGSSSTVSGINASGVVVGSAQDANGEWRAYSWSAEEGMVDLNTRLLDAPATTQLLSALAVSDTGAIVALSNTGLVLLEPIQ